MKVKRFENLWAMGLILFGAILIVFYIIKIFFPQFIIGIAETPRIVEIGTAIQSNKWFLHLFNFANGYINNYFLTCACCRTYKLNWKGNIILISCLILLSIFMEVYPQHYANLNFICLLAIPFLTCLVNKKVSSETFISTVVCFCLDILFQIFSLLVRDLTVMTIYPNIVTILVLLIDVYIWRILLYLFYNYKKDKGE